MSYVATAVVRSKDGWGAAELELTGAADIEEIADQLREVEPPADVSLLFVEADDAYLVILRLDQGEDLRVFGSDSSFADESRIGAMLLGDIEIPALEIDKALAEPDDESDERRPAADPEADPVGDADLLADLGLPAHRLLRLCAREGMLPADITAEICQAIGCGDELEELREA
ncbi:tRNA adenosine deaminase-associated protein [Natronosporangium hydrolyticum]|uniref:tRNA adenosine deaminase-associated protein n=1 Tax=Natronosporangium hydrolyticum TaxID=2811111 RepID=A0A895YBP6_9ACTN|nr:tRNA adenosine deaminase-associated protein [Natronosporangium hydrolyticum]QSB14861.1 tRNA adenosine deaminase-associated protein [Natronosporangium hydrolyticum]